MLFSNPVILRKADSDTSSELETHNMIYAVRSRVVSGCLSAYVLMLMKT